MIKAKMIIALSIPLALGACGGGGGGSSSDSTTPSGNSTPSTTSTTSGSTSSSSGSTTSTGTTSTTPTGSGSSGSTTTSGSPSSGSTTSTGTTSTTPTGSGSSTTSSTSSTGSGSSTPTSTIHYLYSASGSSTSSTPSSSISNNSTLNEYTIGANGALAFTSTFALLPSIYTDSLTVGPTGKYAYVLAGSGGSNGSRTSVESVYQFTVGTDGSFIPMTLPSITTNIASGWATRFVMDATGQYAYVAGPSNPNSPISNALYIYAVGSNGSLSLISTITASSDITGIAVNASTKTLYTAVGGGSASGVISLTAYQIGSNGLLTAIAAPLSIPSSVVAGDIVIDPSGKYCYVTVLGSPATSSTSATKGSVYEYTIGSNGALTPMSTPFMSAAGVTPHLAIDTSGQYAYIVNFGDNAISQYTIGANGVLSPMSTPTIASASGAYAISANPAGGSMYVTSSGTGYITTYNIGSGGSLTATATTIAPNQGWANMPLVATH